MTSGNSFKDEIISPTWDLISDDIELKKFYFFPWLLSIIFFTGLLLYQTIYTYVEIFWKQEQAFKIILSFFHSEYVVTIAVVTVIFLIVYILVAIIFEWWLIHLINAKKNDKNMSYGDAIWRGIYSFIPIFEFNNIFSEFKLISLLNLYLFAIRFVWLNNIKYINIVFVVLILISLVMNILLWYTKYFIVLENKKAAESIWKSAHLSILNFSTSIKLYFLMLMLNTRVVINFLVFLLFPIWMAFAFIYVTSKVFLAITTIWLWILFLAFLILISYLTTVLEIFKVTAWYYAYLNGRDKIEEGNE